MRLDSFLAKNYATADDGREFSRAQFQKLIAQGRVKINGIICENSSREVTESDAITINFPVLHDFSAEIAAFANNNVIYEDENVVVVNKPAGILTHKKGALSEEFTVADFVKSCIAHPEDFADDNRAGIVHRLDRATSGVLIAAKNLSTMKFLAAQFQDRKAKKKYLALVERAPKNPAAKIDLPIARNPKSPATFRVDPGGKNAITFYETSREFPDGSALVALSPHTGRTHQLRVHMSYIGAPIVGDPIYSAQKISQKFQKKSSDAREHLRMFLHAKELEITIPNSHGANLRKTFSADLPEDFQTEITRRENSTKKLEKKS